MLSIDKAKNAIERRLFIINEMATHDDEAIRQTADQLKSMQFDFNIGLLELPFTVKKDEFLLMLREILLTDFDTFSENLNFEPRYSEGDKEEWLWNARYQRIKLLCDKFILLSRLRDDEPEAWDEVNELYFDD